MGCPEPSEPEIPNIKRTVTYRLHYRYPWCFDGNDGAPGHDELWSDDVDILEASNDQAAQLASLTDKYHQSERCYHGRRSYPLKITKTVAEETDDDWQRQTETEVALPRAERCACGKTYWPVKGEQACHKMIEA